MPTNIRALTSSHKKQIKELAQTGKAYTEIVTEVGGPADYATVKAYCESIETWGWQAAKRDISQSLKRIERAGQQQERINIAKTYKKRRITWPQGLEICKEGLKGSSKMQVRLMKRQNRFS